MRQRITVTDTGAGFVIDEETPDSVMPQTHKATAREAIARVMQLLQVGPVAPQTWPEEVCIGFIETKDSLPTEETP